MKTISITSENGETFSSISNFFIDYYMTSANGEFVKIYLYMIRLQSIGRPVSIQEIADHFQCTQKDVCRAIRYWVDRDVLRLEYNQQSELIGITVLKLYPPAQQEESDRTSGMELLHPMETDASEKVYPLSQTRPPVPDANADALQTATVSASKRTATIPMKKSYSSTEINQRNEDAEFASILYQFEMYCGHSPVVTELQTLLYIYEQLQFPATLLEYLIEYCASLGHTSHCYMEKVAIDWYQRGIRTAEDAKRETAAYNALNTAISREMGLKRVLTPIELRYINKWKNDYSFQQDIIIEACQRAGENNKLTFRYVNGILTDWHNRQVTSLDDIHKLDEQHQAQKKAAAKASSTKVQNIPFNNFQQQGYDNKDLESFFIKEIQNITKQPDNPDKLQN